MQKFNLVNIRDIKEINKIKTDPSWKASNQEGGSIMGKRIIAIISCAIIVILTVLRICLDSSSLLARMVVVLWLIVGATIMIAMIIRLMSRKEK